MRLYSNITTSRLDVNSDGFASMLEARVRGSSENTPVDATHDARTHRITIRQNGVPVTIDDKNVQRETFVLNRQGTALEVVASIPKGTFSFLFYLPTSELTDDIVQAVYNMTYDIADGHDNVTGQSLQVLEFLDENDFFNTREEDAEPAYQSQASQVYEPQSIQANTDDASDIISSLLGATTQGRNDMNQYQYSPQPRQQRTQPVSSVRHNLESLLEQLDQSSSDAKKEASELRDKLTQQYIVNESLRDQYNQAQNERDALQGQISDQQSKIDSQQRHIVTLESNIDAANTSRQKAEQELAQQKARYSTLEDETKKKLASATSAMSTVQGQLKSEKQHTTELSKAIDGYRQQIADRDSTISQLRGDINRSKEKVTSLQSQYAQLRDAREQDKRDIAAQYEQQVNDALNDAANEREKASQAIADANKALEDFSNRAIASMKRQKEQYDADIAAQRKSNDDMSTLVDEVTKDRDALRAQVTFLTRSSSSSRARVSDIQATLDATKSELSSANSRIQQYEARIAEFDQRIANERRATDVARDNARRQTSVAASKYAEAIQMRDEFEGIINGLNASISDGNIDADELRSRVQAFLDVINQSKETDDDELLRLVDADTDDVQDVDGVYKTDDDVATESNQDEEEADEAPVTDDFDDDFSFPTDGFDGFASDDDLAGTPLSNTGNIDGDILMDVVNGE